MNRRTRTILSRGRARRYARGMESSDNPYQVPQSASAEPSMVSGGGGLARQVTVVAILMMVQGGLEMLMGIFFVIFGGAMAVYARQEAVQQGLAFGGVSGAMGMAGMVTGLLHVVAGWQSYFFRRRWLGFLALFTGLGSMLTCYCFPTALVLMIYGLIVYASAQTAWAFELGRRGMSREQILMALYTQGF